MTLYPWPLLKLSSYDVLSRYWPAPAAAEDFHYCCSASSHHLTAAAVVMPSGSESAGRPKLSFGIDVILGDRIGATTRQRPITTSIPNYAWGVNNDPPPPVDVQEVKEQQLDGDQQQQKQQQQQQQDKHPNRRKRSWSRAVFSNLQRKGLEKRFQLQKYITKPDRRQLAATLGLTDAQVKVWFQNRRMKWRHNQDRLKTMQQLQQQQQQHQQGESAAMNQIEDVLSASDDGCSHN